MKSLSKKIKKYKRVTKKVYIGSGNIANNQMPVEPPPPISMKKTLRNAEFLVSGAKLGAPSTLLVNNAELQIHLKYSNIFNEILEILNGNPKPTIGQIQRLLINKIMKNKQDIERAEQQVELFKQLYLNRFA